MSVFSNAVIRYIRFGAVDKAQDFYGAPVLVVPNYRGVGRQVLRWVAPVMPILELIQDAV